MTAQLVTDLNAIRILFRAPDSLALYGIPYEMRKDVGQEPRHLWRAADARLDRIARGTRPDAAGKSPTEGWVFLQERDNEVRAWLSALDDVPEDPMEWCEAKLATDETLSTTRRHDELATVVHSAGDVVRVLPGYRQPMGSYPARFVGDGTEGLYLVKAPMRDGCDYRLITFRNELLLSQLTSAQRKHVANTHEWDLICSPSRFVRHFWPSR